ncbi:uncharacterized protein PG998_001114 [Apiospora kogelbergensis]|uniref:uncharacterized protein n=1 Tax=Apiospora kogelbergensis TaxID=1337665 RepID=UPI0031323E06
MSSTSGLSRTRSLRKPAPVNAGPTNQKENKLPSAPANDPSKASPSRLPQVRPLTRSATTTASTSASTRLARTTNPTRASSTITTSTPPISGAGRPLPGVLSSRNGPAATRRPTPTTAENTAAAAAAKPLGRAPSTRQTPSAPANIRSASRESSTSTQRPSSSGGISSISTATARSKTAGHARAKSTATGLTAATTLKPPSSRVSTAASVASSTKPTTRSQTLQARGAGHRVSASTSSAATTTAPPSLAGPNRPVFNNNQQHYSPLKSHAPKPLTSTFLAPPSPSKLPANVAISAETARLQTELLQLSLLHRDAGATAADWHESAQQKLGSRFEELVQAERALGGRERDGVEGRNAAVLVRWGAAQASTEVVGGLEEKVQMLDQVVNGVWRFGEPGGRYARVVEEFENWAGRLQGIMEARRKGDVNSLLGGGCDGVEKGDVLFIGDLENRWRDECPSLVRKLEEWRRMLRHLGPAPDRGNGPTVMTEESVDSGDSQNSSLAKILDGCTSMVDDMLAELALMEQMVREAIRAEDDWIEAMNKELNLGNEKDTPSDTSAPLWKMVA